MKKLILMATVVFTTIAVAASEREMKKASAKFGPASAQIDAVSFNGKKMECSDNDYEYAKGRSDVDITVASDEGTISMWYKDQKGDPKTAATFVKDDARNQWSIGKDRDRYGCILRQASPTELIAECTLPSGVFHLAYQTICESSQSKCFYAKSAVFPEAYVTSYFHCVID